MNFPRIPIIIVCCIASMVSFLSLRSSDWVWNSLLSTILRRSVATKTSFVPYHGLRVLMCGTGTPVPDKSRASQCVAIVAGNQTLIFDTGEGSSENLQLMGFPLEELNAVFFTHFHSDHIADFGQISLNRWIRGATKPLHVYGPTGTVRVVSGIKDAYYLDYTYRLAHHTSAYMPPAGWTAIPHNIDICGADDLSECSYQDRSKIVYETDDLTVRAFLVHHEPASPAFGYRVDYKGRSVVISGDTLKCDEVIYFSKDAEVLIHDAINKHVVTEMAKSLSASDSPFNFRLGKLLMDTLDYHADPDDAIDVAASANVSLLVLTHMVPPRRNAVLRRVARIGWGEVRPNWPGEWVEAEDGMIFDLSADDSQKTIRRSKISF